MTWLEVCQEVVGPTEDDSEAQTYYGRLLAMNGICELVTSQLVGVASDKYGRRPVQIAAQMGQAPQRVKSRVSSKHLKVSKVQNAIKPPRKI